MPDFVTASALQKPKNRAAGTGAHPPGLTLQRGFSLLELSLVLSFIAIVFVVAVAVREGWSLLELDLLVAEQARTKSENQASVIAAAVRDWYLHEYCGGGAVDRPKVQLAEGASLACDALPLPPHLRSGLDTGEQLEYRYLAPYLPDQRRSLLDDPAHGYTWEIGRPAPDPSNPLPSIEVLDCNVERGFLDCDRTSVMLSARAQVEIIWSPPAHAGMTEEDLERLARTVGGTYAPQATAGCLAGLGSYPHVRFPKVTASVPFEQRPTLLRNWITRFSGTVNAGNMNQDADGDGDVDGVDYVGWGC